MAGAQMASARHCHEESRGDQPTSVEPVTGEDRPAEVPLDWVRRDCARQGCLRMVWVPDLDVIVPVCSVMCAVEVMDATEDVTPRRVHHDTPECWCSPMVTYEDGVVGTSLVHNR